MKKFALKSYTVTLFGDNNYQRTIITTSPGKAKYQYYLDVQDCFDISFFEFCKNCKVTSGSLYTSEEFTTNAKYRGIEFARCGMMVKGNNYTGYIVGYNESANLDILMTEGKYNGQVANVHPYELEYYNLNGILIKSFKNESQNIMS